MTIIPRRISATIVLLLAPIALGVVSLVARGSVPDPLPIHWNVHDEVDNTASVGGFITVSLVIALALTVIGLACVWLTHSAIAGRMAAATMIFGGWLVAMIVVMTMLAAHGAQAAADVTMPWYAIVAVIAVPILLAVVGWLLLPGRWPRARPNAAVSSPSRIFEPGESVTWISHQHAPLMYALSALTAVAGAVLVVAPLDAAWGIAIALFAVAVVTAFTGELAVRIDGRGVTTLWGPFSWPRQHIALADIAAVHAELIRPMAWGGWGYRVSPRGVAAIIRGGPGLVIDRADKPTYVVTVPDAADGADVLAGLLERARR